MNKMLVIMVTDEGIGKIDAGGLELTDIDGVRQAISMTTFAGTYLNEVLVNLRAKELAENATKAEDLPAADSGPE